MVVEMKSENWAQDLEISNTIGGGRSELKLLPLKMGQKLFNVYPLFDYVHKIDVLMADIRQ